MHPKRTVIIGGTGLIGCYLAADLISAGHKVKVLSRSTRFAAPEALSAEQIKEIELVHGEMSDVELLTDAINDADIVFHKTLSQGMSGAVENSQQFLQNKVGAAAAVIEALRKAQSKPELLVLGSSISVYGEGAYQCVKCGPVRPELRYRLPAQKSFSAENGSNDLPDNDSGNRWNPMCPVCGGRELTPVFLDESGERRGQSVYAVAKKAEEDLLDGACQMNAVSMVGLRYGTIIGAGQSWHNPFTHFLDLLSDGKPPRLHEDGMQTRDYMFIQDVVRANLAALKKHRPGTNFYNAVSAKPTALLDVANELISQFEKITGKKQGLTPVIDNALIPGDVRHCHTSSRGIERDLDFNVSVELTRGLDDLVEWYARKKNISRTSSKV
jgi:dTDP-L-rhamnose 4-epimerase